MDNKIVAVIIIVLLIVVGAAYVMGTQNSNTPAVTVNNSTGNNTVHTLIHKETLKKNNTKTNDTTQIKISASQAQELATKTLKNNGLNNWTVGTPELYIAGSEKVWDVQVYDDTGQPAGWIYVNAVTGKVDDML